MTTYYQSKEIAQKLLAAIRQGKVKTSAVSGSMGMAYISDEELDKIDPDHFSHPDCIPSEPALNDPLQKGLIDTLQANILEGACGVSHAATTKNLDEYDADTAMKAMMTGLAQQNAALTGQTTSIEKAQLTSTSAGNIGTCEVKIPAAPWKTSNGQWIGNDQNGGLLPSSGHVGLPHHQILPPTSNISSPRESAIIMTIEELRRQIVELKHKVMPETFFHCDFWDSMHGLLEDHLLQVPFTRLCKGDEFMLEKGTLSFQGPNDKIFTYEGRYRVNSVVVLATALKVDISPADRIASTPQEAGELLDNQVLRNGKVCIDYSRAKLTAVPFLAKNVKAIIPPSTQTTQAAQAAQGIAQGKTLLQATGRAKPRRKKS